MPSEAQKRTNKKWRDTHREEYNERQRKYANEYNAKHREERKKYALEYYRKKLSEKHEAPKLELEEFLEQFDGEVLTDEEDKDK
jgi:hypothetical protein